MRTAGVSASRPVVVDGPSVTESVIDRYINHSCAPNCITEVVTVEKENKIIISSCRRIQRGEEVGKLLWFLQNL